MINCLQTAFTSSPALTSEYKKEKLETEIKRLKAEISDDLDKRCDVDILTNKIHDLYNYLELLDWQC